MKFFDSIHAILEQYTVREVRIHVRHVNELIHACDPLDLYNGNNGYSLCIVNDILNSDTPSAGFDRFFFVCLRIDQPILMNIVDRRKGLEGNSIDFNVPEYLLPNQKEISLVPLFATNTKIKVRIVVIFDQSRTE